MAQNRLAKKKLNYKSEGRKYRRNTNEMERRFPAGRNGPRDLSLIVGDNANNNNNNNKIIYYL